MQIKINKKKYEVRENETVLDVCRREGIRIPTLCSYGKLKKEAVCRLCLVEITPPGAKTSRRGVSTGGKLTISCTTKVVDGMEIVTESENIQKARAVNLELLWSDHAGKCIKCKKNRQCELQKLAEEYKIENFHFVPRRAELTSREENELLRENWSRTVLDDENPVIERDSQYCVECRRCINICPVASYGFNHRAGDVVVGTPYNSPLDCIFCGACVAHCPTGALSDQGDISEIITDLEDINILSVALVDPAVLKSVSNELSGAVNLESLAGSLRALGFEKVFSLGWGFQKYVENVLEEIHPHHASKNKSNTKSRKFISNFCPSAELYIKKYFPELAKNILDIKRPEELMAEAVKNEYAKKEKINSKNIRVMLISSCVARKKMSVEAIDHILTVREFGRIARKKKIVDVPASSAGKMDKFLGETKKECADLHKYGRLSKILGGQIRKELSIGRANGALEIKNALSSVLKKEKQYDFLEVMICPEGCEHGGGQSNKI